MAQINYILRKSPHSREKLIENNVKLNNSADKFKEKEKNNKEIFNKQ